MLRVYYGPQVPLRSGALKRAKEILDGGGQCLMIVPEAATLKTERFFLRSLGLEGTFDLEVLSPSRLGDRVFEALGRGGEEQVTLDERGKAVAVAAALKDCKKDLGYYASAADMKGFVEQVSGLIGDLKKASLTPETLRDFADSLPEGPDKARSLDIAEIYAAYEKRMGGRLVDGEDVNVKMLRRLEEGGFGRGKRVIVMDFDLITLGLSALILALCRSGAEVDLYQRCVPGDNLYRPVGESLGRLRNAAKETGVPCAFAFARGGDPDLPRGIAALRNYFPMDDPKSVPGDPDGVRLYTGATPYEECRFVVEEMCRLHREGLPWHRMSVVLLSPDEYSSPLRRQLELNGVPHYLPRPLPAIGHDAARFVIGSLRCAFGNYRSKDLTDLLQSAYTGLDDREAWALSAYISSYGIQGKRFTAAFTRGTEEEILAASAARDKLLPPLERLKENCPRGADTDQLIGALVTYLEEKGVFERLMDTEKKLLDLGLEDEAVQGRQMWTRLMGLMDQMHEIMGKEPLPRALFLEQLQAALETCMLNGLPPRGGVAQCLPAGGVAQEDMGAVFITGFNDDAFEPGPEGLMPDHARKALETFGKTHIRPDGSGREDLKRLDLYRALCSTGERLYLSRCAASQKGESKRAHAYLHRIRAVLPGLREEGGLTASADKVPGTKDQAAEELVRLFSSGEPLPPDWRKAWREINAFYPDTTDGILSALRPPEKITDLSASVTKALYPEKTVSVSRLEAFAACPYKHFVEYGLRPLEKKEWNVDAAAAGSFYHSVLEALTSRLMRLPGWPDCSRADVERLVDEVSGPMFLDRFGDMASDLPKVETLRIKYLRVLRRVAWSFTAAARASAFSVMGSEIRFGYPDENSLPPVPIDLPDGGRVLLRGVIDRIDRYQGDEGMYFRVVDYKSGGTKLEPEKLYYGTQLQLMLYLAAVRGGPDNGEPAGAYYMHLKDDLIPDDETVKGLETLLAKKCALTGITLKDVRVVKLMDASEPPVSFEESLLTAKGEFGKNKPVAAMADLERLILHARECARRIVISLTGGVIKREPLRIAGDERDECSRCDYAAICRVEEAGQRRGQRMNYEELFRTLEEEQG